MLFPRDLGFNLITFLYTLTKSFINKCAFYFNHSKLPHSILTHAHNIFRSFVVFKIFVNNQQT
jgi:hypothetical protein